MDASIIITQVQNLWKSEKNTMYKLRKQVKGAMELPEYKASLSSLRMEKQEIISK